MLPLIRVSQSEDSDEGEEAWQETGSESSTEPVRLQYLYIQMEYCEKSTLRNLIDEGLHQDEERVWRLLREIVEGLAHIHSQVTVLFFKPVNVLSSGPRDILPLYQPLEVRSYLLSQGKTRSFLTQ